MIRLGAVSIKVECLISKAVHPVLFIEEFYYLQQAKKYHLELQRLAGKKVVDGLNLYQYNANTALFQGKEQVK